MEHDVFLNDIIIDFYVTYLFFSVLAQEDRPTVHVFSTMFFKRLATAPIKVSKCNSFEKDFTLNQAQKRHLRVKGWTKNVDLFEKDLIIIPICEHSHWFLVIVIKPGLLRLEVEERQGEPFVLVLDSLGGSNSTAVSYVIEYLGQEWLSKVRLE